MSKATQVILTGFLVLLLVMFPGNLTSHLELLRLSREPYGGSAWVEMSLAFVIASAVVMGLLAGLIAHRLFAVSDSMGTRLERQSHVFRSIAWDTVDQQEPLLRYPWIPKPAAYRWSFAVSLLVGVLCLVLPAQEFGTLKLLLAPLYGLAGFSLSVCFFKWRFDAWAKHHTAEVEQMVKSFPRAVARLSQRETQERER